MYEHQGRRVTRSGIGKMQHDLVAAFQVTAVRFRIDGFQRVVGNVRATQHQPARRQNDRNRHQHD